MRPRVCGIVPAVNDFSQLRAFVKSEYPRCVLMHWTVSDLEKAFAMLSAAKKTALIHCDLTLGLAPDSAAVEFLVRRFAPEGIISTKTAAVCAARELGVTAVQRVFLIDSAALKKSSVSVARAEPDYVEFLPAPCPALFARLRSTFGVPLIAGGLISSREEAEELLSHGEIEAVSVSMATLRL